MKAQYSGDRPSFGVMDYLGVGTHTSPNFTPNALSIGNVSAARDLHFGLRLHKYLPGQFYISIAGHATRFQNEVSYQKTELSTSIQNDSIVNIKTTTDFELKNDYLVADVRLGIGKVIRHKRWGLDVQAGVGYRVWVNADLDFIDTEENEYEVNTSNVVSPQGNIHFTLDVHLRYYVDKDSYFLIGSGYQNSRSIRLAENDPKEKQFDATVSFSSFGFYIGYGFDF